ncbi:hypothetical protein EV356DRAFT_538237 [Viridothelium virens]|uniref:Uncharacterized protein n=1 Tax=Viridothelium virens TaxID=1048519 RepID=A0A6A6GRI4_VIRVR|nr:hypothetical protein EV356DRAFT_538237 [Viridothelium virens]
MAGSHLTNDEASVLFDWFEDIMLIDYQFLTRLASLISTPQQKGHGSIFLKQKRRTSRLIMLKNFRLGASCAHTTHKNYSNISEHTDIPV